MFLHIQKTAGTSFEKYLVKFLELERPCQCSKGKKRCTCRRPNRPDEVGLLLFNEYNIVPCRHGCSPAIPPVGYVDYTPISLNSS